MTSQSDPNDFDIAKAIASQVQDLPTERKERIFRWVAESLGLALFASRPPATPNQPSPPPVDPSGKPPPPASGGNIKTFIASKQPKGDTQYAAAVAYFYRFEAPAAQQRETINAQMLQDSTRLAGRTRFANPTSTLNNAKRSGYLDGTSPGEFAINSVGENLVAMTLPGGVQNSNGRPAAKKKAAKKKKR